MKFSELSLYKQELIKSYINGETIEYSSILEQEWLVPTDVLVAIKVLSDDQLRIKPKEPVVSHRYTPVFYDGVISIKSYESIRIANRVINPDIIQSYIERTFHDNKFIKAEIIER